MDKEVMEAVQKHYNKIHQEKRQQKIDEQFLQDYEIYNEQQETRFEAKVEAKQKETIKQRLIAIAVAVAILAGAGVYAVDKTGIYRGADNDTYKEQENTSCYEGFIEYVNEMRDLGITIPITEESYKEYIEYVRTEPSNDTVDRGSR